MLCRKGRASLKASAAKKFLKFFEERESRVLVGLKLEGNPNKTKPWGFGEFLVTFVSFRGKSLVWGKKRCLCKVGGGLV